MGDVGFLLHDASGQPLGEPGVVQDPPSRGATRNSRTPKDPNRCRQCWIIREPEAFIGKRGYRVRWCNVCRERHCSGNSAADLAPLPCKVPALEELRAHLVVKSHNPKLGGIPSSLTSRGTCPPSCTFYGAGCYAEVHVLGFHWRRVSTGELGSSWEDFCRSVLALPRGQLWRHNVAGDLPGHGERVNLEALKMLVKANRGKRGFSFSHKHSVKALAAIKWANANGFTVNLSADSLEQADALADSGAGPVVVVVPSKTPDAGLHTPAGRKVIVCPAQKTDGNDTTCATCRLCAIPTRKAIVAFRAHGVCASRVDRLVQLRRPTKTGTVAAAPNALPELEWKPEPRIEQVRLRNFTRTHERRCKEPRGRGVCGNLILTGDVCVWHAARRQA